ncbi:MAG: amino acid permease [Pseudomonadota bacterium]
MGDLTKALGPWRGTAMMLNIVLGAGLLTLPGLAAREAGDGALAVWLVSALVAVPLLVIFGILGRAYPDAGGLATFLKRAYGDAGYAPATFLFLGAVAFGLPAIALTGGHYAAAAIGGPPALYASLLILGAAAANLASSEIAGRINTALASVILFVLVAIAATGWVAVSPDASVLERAVTGVPSLGVFGATFMMVFFAFTGWEVSANLSGEFRNPKRDFPFAMAASFAIAVALYLVLAFIVAASGPLGASEAPFAAILGSRFGPSGSLLVSAVSVLLIFANLSAAIWAVSRMVYSGASERLLPAVLMTLRAGLPLRAVILTTCVLLGVVAAAGAGLVDLGWLLGAAGQNFLLLYAGAAAALIKLTARLGYKALGWFAIALVVGLVLTRGLDQMIYPGLLIGIGLLVAVFRLFVPSGAMDDRQTQGST